MDFQRLEHLEQVDLVKWLRRKGYLVFAVPNGSKLSGNAGERSRQMQKLKREGLLNGVPDLILPQGPPARLEMLCTAIEMKRTGGVPSDVSEDQRKVHEDLRRHGWLVIVAFGFQDAVRQLREYGYEV